MSKTTEVQHYIEQGLTYRQIMEKMKLKSLSSVSYYAKKTHQHRLTRKNKTDIEDKYMNMGLECQVCGERFFSQAEFDFLVEHLSILAQWIEGAAKRAPQEPTV